MNMHDMLERSRSLKLQLADIKKEEMALRLEIAGMLGKDLDPGTHHMDQEGFKVTLKLGLNYSLDQDLLKQMLDNNELSEEEVDLLRLKYDLKLADYKKSYVDTSILDDAVIVKPSCPSIDISIGE